MNRLPAEILPLIIHHLSDHRQDLVSCTLVSRSFYIFTIPILWRVYTEGARKPLAALLLTNHHHHPMLTYARSINLCHQWTDADWLRFMPLVNPFVNAFSIDGGYGLTDASLQYLPQHWPHLTRLQLVDVSVTHITIDALAKQCHQLECLELIDCYSLTSGMFAPFRQDGTTTTKLTQLTLSQRRTSPWNHHTLMDLVQLPLTAITFQGLSWEFMHALLLSPPSWWPNLTSFQLKGIGRLGNDDQHLIHFVQSRPTLTHVALQDSVMTDATLEAMAMYLPYLTWLDLMGSNEITVQGVLCLVRHCTHLAYINLGSCHVMQWSFPRDIIHEDDIVPYYGDILRLTLHSIRSIRQVGLQGNNNNNNNNDDDDYQVWLRTWQRSFTNIRLHGTSVS